MLLKNYIPNLKKNYSDTYFSGISCDSSKVKKNYIFFAIKGNHTDGNKYIDVAIKKGAKIIISEKKIRKKKNNVIFLQFSNVRKLLAEISYKISKTRFKKLIAVTGTNGKSSVSDFYYQILDLNSKKVASIGTIGLRYNKKKIFLSNTTLNPVHLSSLLKDLKEKKIDFVIMEASSHGLKQNRLDGLVFDIGIFTNFSHDHLDYHKNMKDYLNSKLYLFKKLIKKKGDIITDSSIPQKKLLEDISIKKKNNLNLIFNKDKGIELISHEFKNEKQVIKILYKNKTYCVEINLIGKIQIKNILMSMLAAIKSGIKFEKIKKIIPKIKPVEGRLEKIGTIKNNSKVILDYAHTPEALESSLINIKEQFPYSTINLVFGCGGNRDIKKRYIMGKIAEKYSNKIYLTDDNPRNENPSKIRNDIKKGIKKIQIYEIPNRKKAIDEAIKNLSTGELLLIAGKGHEKFQDYGNRKLFFSDKEIILRSIKSKNKILSKNLKINIIKELSKSNLSNQINIKNISINSKNLNKNDIFFAIKGKNIDGNKFVPEAFKKKSSFVVVNRINKNYPSNRQIKVKDTLIFLTKCSAILRKNLNTKIISVTGSCGKSTLKEMIGFTLKKISKTTCSPKSFNNKYGVPLSLFNLKENDEFGVFEVGMDKKNEINYLTKIIKPDLGIITNISYAHSKNFKNIKQIADAKAEIMNHVKSGGKIILNMDDNFYNYHKNLAIKKKLKVISFGIKNKLAMVKLKKIRKVRKYFELSISVNGLLFLFYATNDNKNNIYNILATLATISSFTNIKKLKKNNFLDFKIPEGRGDISEIRFKRKKIFFINETYNSNPLSLKTALENYDKIKLKDSKKYLILGDMLELGKHSYKQHQLISKIINKTNIDKVYVLGRDIRITFKGIKKDKKANILSNKFKINDLIKNDLNNNDYLMMKGSNATGLYKKANQLKKRNFYAI